MLANSYGDNLRPFHDSLIKRLKKHIYYDVVISDLKYDNNYTYSAHSLWKIITRIVSFVIHKQL